MLGMRQELVLIGVLAMGLIGVTSSVFLGAGALHPKEPLAPLAERMQAVRTALDPLPKGSERVPARDVQAAWGEVREILAGVNAEMPDGFQPPLQIVRYPEVLVRQADGNLEHIYGLYFGVSYLDKKGRMATAERILVFLPPADECYLRDILVHELLHSVQQRLKHIGQPVGQMPAEDFVGQLTGKSRPTCR